MRIIKNPFKREKRNQSQTMITFISNGNEVLCPIGYKPLSKDENVQRCVFKIADMVSNMTVMLMENGVDGDRRIRNELSKKIDINPNKNMTRKNFVHRIVAEMCNSGNSVVFPKYNGELLDNLEFMRNCSFVKNRDSYLIRHQGKAYAPDEVLHFVLNPDEDEPFKGVGFAPLLKDTIKNLAQANATKTGFLKSKWKPSLIISTNSDSDELKDREKRRKVLESYTSTSEVGEPWLIPAGEIDVKTIQPLTLNDLAIQESITLDLKTAACAVGLPPFLVGIGDFKKEEYNNFIATVIMSFATIIQQEYTKKLLYSPHWYFKFNSKSLMQYSLAEKSSFVKEMVSGGMMSRNEGRCEFDYSPVDKTGMNDYIVLENYIPVEKVGEQKKLKGGGE